MNHSSHEVNLASPTDFACWNQADKVISLNHMIAKYCNHHQCEPVVELPNCEPMTLGGGTTVITSRTGLKSLFSRPL